MKNWRTVLFIIFAAFLFGLLLRENFSQRVAQHFSLMAEAFNHGRLDLMRLDPGTGRLDIFFHKGQAHWANFPFPAIILMPFVYIFEHFGLFFYQGYLQFFINLGVFAVSFLFARHFKFNLLDSLFLAVAFLFGSNYSYAAFSTGSWYYSQPVTVILLLLALYEWYTRRRYVLMGLLLGALLATRVTSGFAVFFFFISILYEPSVALKKKFANLALLLLPVVVSGLILLAYNQARFGNPWETGYSDENISPEFQVTMLKRHGILKLENIPTNIYWNFVALPEPIFENDTYHLVPPFFKPNPIGMSFFIMSPIFLLIFKTVRKPTGEQIRLWLGSLAVLIPLLMWYSTGFWQVGARYILDLFPLWFVLLLTAFHTPKLLPIHKIVIIVSTITNLFWVLPALI